jgi:hypothetical protein
VFGPEDKELLKAFALFCGATLEEGTFINITTIFFFTTHSHMLCVHIELKKRRKGKEKDDAKKI